jgi:hypothetical protein
VLGVNIIQYIFAENIGTYRYIIPPKEKFVNRKMQEKRQGFNPAFFK